MDPHLKVEINLELQRLIKEKQTFAPIDIYKILHRKFPSWDIHYNHVVDYIKQLYNKTKDITYRKTLCKLYDMNNSDIYYYYKNTPKSYYALRDNILIPTKSNRLEIPSKYIPITVGTYLEKKCGIVTEIYFVHCALTGKDRRIRINNVTEPHVIIYKSNKILCICPISIYYL